MLSKMGEKLFEPLEMIAKSNFELTIRSSLDPQHATIVALELPDKYVVGPGEIVTAVRGEPKKGKKSEYKAKNIENHPDGVTEFVLSFPNGSHAVRFELVETRHHIEREMKEAAGYVSCPQAEYEARQKEMAAEMATSRWFS